MLRLNCSQSTPESWAQFTHDHIQRSEQERMASVQLRALIDNVLNDTSRDMREQADAVDNSFQRRIAEMQDAKDKMEENLKKVRIWLTLINSALTLHALYELNYDF
jgi:tektin-4